MTGRSTQKQPLIPSPSQTVGPFFDFCLTPDTRHGTLFPATATRLRIGIRVIDGADQSVTDAAVEIWQTADAPGGDFAFGRLGTGEDGGCEFDTVRPCEPADGHAAHINICLFARGLLRHLHTRMYFAGDPKLAGDAVLARVPAERRATLIAQPDSSSPGRWTFVIHLQGPHETVFFDV
jgi:protocatechuate 3,4-dioxygenase alpha subunit